MPDMLTRADLANMTPAEIEKARAEGRIEGVSDGSESEGGAPNKSAPNRRKQRTRSALVDMLGKAAANPDTVASVEESINAGEFDEVLDGATHVIDVATGAIYDVVGTNEDDLEPIVKAPDAAGEDRESLASKVLKVWVPLTSDIYLKAADAVNDPGTPATKKPLPLKPAYADAIKSGEMVVVDQETGAVLVQMKTDKDRKQEEATAKRDQERKNNAPPRSAPGDMTGAAT